ncbi:hypothetical protein AGABI2DRAFT_146934 [Agaricus bisporus var. bisporus H97]|uniref:hypothetical protein n=1 Tax=Agaricus bisporus var. bisporus (strain H97 / ATCC MYA-4626 / FGSC 10389) TaxID=936046 RepID=UPI00029F54DF|nr:hypothetical protein AGABI2DRAFT_146934 [Agaricus bisporus var. bisporus H97]EKV41761.1 hypothetical protein AGABI2DRAFT_146934 [Agaricus bisporus var. bisporus H97]
MPSELLACVPGAYREIMRDAIIESMKARRQLASSEKQLARLVTDKANHITPPPLRMKVPTVQYVKSFIVANPDVPNAFDASVSTFQDQLLTHAIQLKTEEVNFLRQSIALADPNDANGASPAFLSLLERLNGRFDSVHRDAKKAIFGPPTEETHGRSTFQGWEQDDSVVSEYSAFVADVPAIITRALAIVDDALLAEETKAEKKRNLKDSAMMDVDEHITSKAIQSAVDKRVAQLLSDKKGKPKAKKPGKPAGQQAKAEASGSKPKQRGNAAGKGRVARRAKGRQGDESQSKNQKKDSKGKGKAN